MTMQVWEATPACGDTPFLDTLWMSVDEVTPQDKGCRRRTSITFAVVGSKFTSQHMCMDLLGFQHRRNSPVSAMQAISLQDCDVYSYKSDGETDPLSTSQLSMPSKDIVECP